MSVWVRSYWKALTGYILLVGVLFLPVFIVGNGALIYGDDIHHQYYFYRQFFNEWLKEGIIPWWNPYYFSGAPFMASPIVNPWYLLNWLYVILPLSSAYSVHLAFHVLWSMTGMYALMRRNGLMRPFGPIGAWISGLFFGLSGFFMARTWAGHVDVIAAASWMPWVVFAFANTVNSEQKTENRKAIVISAGVFAMQLLAGYQTMAMMTVIIVGIISGLTALQSKSLRPLLLTLCSLFLGIGLAAVHLLPVSEFIRQSVRTYPFPYSWISYGSWEWRSLLQLIKPFIFGNQHTYQGPPPNFIEHSAFVGVGGLALAGIGVYTLFKSRKVLNVLGFSCLIAVIYGIWVSLGPNAPVDLQYVLWKFIPMYKYLRIPPRHLILVVFGLSGLAGIGFSVLSQSLKYLKILIAGIVVIEMIWFARGFIEARPVPEARHDAELIALLKQDTEPYRVLQNFGVWLLQRDALDFDAVMSYGIFSATGYDPVMLRSYYEFVAQATGKQGGDAILEQDVQVPYLIPASSDTIDFLNIKYILVPPAHDPFLGNSRYSLIRESNRYQYRLYENTTVKPRFFPENSACGVIEVVSYTPNEIRLSADVSCDTHIKSSEVWYPGWEVYIDDKKSYIKRTEDTFRTVFVPSGKHTIEYRFRPVIFVYGGVMSLLSVAVVVRMIRKKT